MPLRYTPWWRRLLDRPSQVGACRAHLVGRLAVEAIFLWFLQESFGWLMDKMGQFFPFPAFGWLVVSVALSLSPLLDMFS